MHNGPAGNGPALLFFRAVTELVESVILDQF